VTEAQGAVLLERLAQLRRETGAGPAWTPTAVQIEVHGQVCDIAVVVAFDRGDSPATVQLRGWPASTAMSLEDGPAATDALAALIKANIDEWASTTARLPWLRRPGDAGRNS
jgi:hypothetical protein